MDFYIVGFIFKNILYNKGVYFWIFAIKEIRQSANLLLYLLYFTITSWYMRF